MKMTLRILGATALFSILISSCKKGDTGPEGPAGPPGSPNVMYSAWFRPPSYQKDTIFGIWGFRFDKAEPKITQQILDSGIVLTYGKLLGYNPAIWPTNRVSQLPITLNYLQSGKTHLDTWSAHATPANLRIRFVNDNNEYNVIAIQHEFRYIIIPGGVSVTGRRSLSYEEICRTYGIPE
ncbi:MAG: hypothetical protein J7527_05010 [Chitinophagaceae bacterium]|nr:hypothetical protein [Chitinophagaceae bacterium]